MTDPHSDVLTTHFDEPGTIPKPGPVGRVVRLAWGALLAVVVWNASRCLGTRATRLGLR